MLAAQGRHRVTRPGDVLFAEGDRDCDFFVVLAGKVAAVEGTGHPRNASSLFTAAAGSSASSAC